jgi:hypothetical protein
VKEDDARRERESQRFNEALKKDRDRDNNPLLYFVDLKNWFVGFRWKMRIGIILSSFCIAFPWLKDIYYLIYCSINFLLRVVIMKPSRALMDMLNMEEHEDIYGLINRRFKGLLY